MIASRNKGNNCDYHFNISLLLTKQLKTEYLEHKKFQLRCAGDLAMPNSTEAKMFG